MQVNCVAYHDGRRIADLQAGEVKEVLAYPEAFVWQAIKDPEGGELEALAQEYDLHPLAVEDACKGHQRPKIEEFGASLFVILHVLEIHGDELAVHEVAIFAGKRYVLSVRRGAQRGFADVRARCEAEPELLRHGAGYVLYALMDAVVDRYFPVIDALESELEGIEERIFAGRDVRANIEALYALKQKLMTVKHAAAPLLEVTGKLYGGRVPAICYPLQDYFRDIADHLQRVNQSIDALRDMVATALSVNLALITIQESEVTKQLASYAALVAVPTLIAGVYGMNFQHMPELSWWYGYPLALGSMVVIDIWLFIRFRRAKWL